MFEKLSVKLLVEASDVFFFFKKKLEQSFSFPDPGSRPHYHDLLKCGLCDYVAKAESHALSHCNVKLDIPTGSKFITSYLQSAVDHMPGLLKLPRGVEDAEVENLSLLSLTALDELSFSTAAEFKVVPQDH